jgi:hypothetical protein
MAGPSKIEALRDSCTYRTLMVRCPELRVPASVVAAKWQLTNGTWAPWKIVDCPLLPAGRMICAMECLAQLDASAR